MYVCVNKRESKRERERERERERDNRQHIYVRNNETLAQINFYFFIFHRHLEA